MDDRGYDDRPVCTLTAAELLEQALQAADSAGHYAATDQAYSFWHNEAIQRRDACFEELKRRLEAYGQLEGAVSRLLQHREAGNEHPIDWQRLVEALEAPDGN